MLNGNVRLHDLIFFFTAVTLVLACFFFVAACQ